MTSSHRCREMAEKHDRPKSRAWRPDTESREASNLPVVTLSQALASPSQHRAGDPGRSLKKVAKNSRRPPKETPGSISAEAARRELPGDMRTTSGASGEAEKRGSRAAYLRGGRRTVCPTTCTRVNPSRDVKPTFRARPGLPGSELYGATSRQTRPPKLVYCSDPPPHWAIGFDS